MRCCNTDKVCRQEETALKTALEHIQKEGAQLLLGEPPDPEQLALIIEQFYTSAHMAGNTVFSPDFPRRLAILEAAANDVWSDDQVAAQSFYMDQDGSAQAEEVHFQTEEVHFHLKHRLMPESLGVADCHVGFCGEDAPARLWIEEYT